MTRYNNKIYSAPTFATFLAIALVFIALIALSWAVTIGVVYLIFLCFGLEYSVLVATGIWLLLLLLSTVFGKGISIKYNK